MFGKELSIYLLSVLICFSSVQEKEGEGVLLVFFFSYSFDFSQTYKQFLLVRRCVCACEGRGAGEAIYRIALHCMYPRKQEEVVSSIFFLYFTEFT